MADVLRPRRRICAAEERVGESDAVVFSNATGDVFTPDQRAAFRSFVENGGGFVGIHGAGDSSHRAWDWYVNAIIGTRFIGHPMDPQFQKATVRIEHHDHPATAGLADSLERVDEWYSFDKSPRGIPGLTVLATLDESTYKPGAFLGTELAMGKDHPIAWWRCAGKGRVFYAAGGHTAEIFSDAAFRKMVSGAIKWATGSEGVGCRTVAEATGPRP